MTETKTGTETKTETTFTEADTKDLRAIEKKITNRLKSFYSLGELLNTIKVRSLQVIKGYPETAEGFESYLRDRFDISKVYCYKMIQAYEVCTVIEEYGFNDLPKTESQCRPLALLLETPELLSTVWEALVNSEEKITAKTIKKEVDNARGKDTGDTENTESTGNTEKGKKGESTENKDSENKDSESKSSAKDALIAKLKEELAQKEKEAEELRAELAQRRNTRDGIPGNKLAKELFKAGFRAVSKKYHPDHGGTSEQMREVLELKRILGI